MLSVTSISPVSPHANVRPNDLRDALHAKVDGAPHLRPEERIVTKDVIDDLIREGHVSIAESDQGRFKAVAGVQWAMESVMRGLECIVTPERATPFRTCGDQPQPEAQRIRKDALLERLQRDDPLHLIFCHDGTGAPEQDMAYREQILSRFGTAGDLGRPGLHEHVLPFARSAFPSEASGAFILAKDGNTCFAIRALQAHMKSADRHLDLFLGKVDVAVPRHGPAPGSETTAQEMIGSWRECIADWLDIDLLRMFEQR